MAESPSEVHDLGVAATHRACRVFATQGLGEHRVELGVLGCFVGKQFVVEERACLPEQHEGFRRWDCSKRVGSGADAIEAIAEEVVLSAEAQAQRGLRTLEVYLGRFFDCDTQHVEDHCDVDRFLEERAVRRPKEPEGGCSHGEQ